MSNEQAFQDCQKKTLIGRRGLTLYGKLLEMVIKRSALLEDYARRMIAKEEQHTLAD